ncbi:MAG: glycosyltransferase family 4 protein [Immundisolibacter sp.]|uniref:glycosyltransferase family 4 protein n=1 Tax=Immundisolibacter sp. TaxID=1934948 RepID=UPI0019CE0586|nr:glycosyltransferase family 4 protein [Immundisolibacter sp.]MBC7162768.1 glycosyltransferase family 4 protein [Immundisolibacter sp.]
MRVLLAHNAYQHRGGEDSVVESELALLRSHGHVVETFFRSNDDVAGMPTLSLARQTLWSGRTSRDLAVLVRRFQPDLIHAHNTFPLISPSLYWAAARAGVPVVQTLHNFRLMCLNALFLRQGRVCEDCMGHLPWRGVARGCYRDSRAASGVLAGMLTLHRGLGTYRHKVARYIALNEFCRGKFIEGGLPAERVVVKPNFVDWAETQSHTDPLPEGDGERQGLLCVGRLSTEKGVAVLVGAMALSPSAQLRVAGEGPQAGLLDGVAGVTRLGSLPGEAVRQEMHRAQALVMPSIWYENFPRTIVEAFACGLPVIASRIGALADIVRDGQTGLLFEPGNARDLADRVAWARANPQRMAAMGAAARAQYEAEFSPEVNYRRLMEIYEGVMAEGR